MQADNSVEMFMFSNSTWQVKKSYPLTKINRIFDIPQDFSNYAVITFKNSFIVFGGITYIKANNVGEVDSDISGGIVRSKIHQFDPKLNQWTELGDLKVPRHSGHGVVYVNGAFIVVGGCHMRDKHDDRYCLSGDTVETETCRFSGKLKVLTIKYVFFF